MNYPEWEKQLLENYKIWGVDNLDLIKILVGLRELTNGKLDK